MPPRSFVPRLNLLAGRRLPPDPPAATVLRASGDPTAEVEIDGTITNAGTEAADEAFRQAFHQSPTGMAMLDLAGRFRDANPALCEILGYPRHELLGQSSVLIRDHDGRHVEERELARLLAGELDSWRAEQRVISAAGRLVWVAQRLTLLRNDAGAPLCMLLQIQDVTDRRAHDERLRHLADHDALTGLRNRQSFGRELEAHHMRTARYGVEGAVLVLDLDHFKTINDTFGHNAGDAALAQVAEAFGSRLRETDLLSRLGGDEFGVLLPKADRQTAQLVARELLGALRNQKIALGGRSGSLGASIGIALFGKAEDVTGEDVLANADLAMYDAKSSERERVSLYQDGGHSRARMNGRPTWAGRLADALNNDGFTLMTQPVFDLSTGRPSHHELLLRMRDEHDDLVLPGAFLHVAERLGIAREIDRWVTRQAIALIESQRARGVDITIEVNLSGPSIDDAELLELIQREVARAGIPARCLVFEVTETAAGANMVHTGRFAKFLADLGCGFALDDFGTGYASFYYLRHLTFDYLKIDGEFITGCVASRTDQLLIKAIVDIAAGLGKRTIAESVGDEATVRLLTGLGVHYGQGFHLGRPVPVSRATYAPSVGREHAAGP